MQTWILVSTARRMLCVGACLLALFVQVTLGQDREAQVSPTIEVRVPGNVQEDARTIPAPSMPATSSAAKLRIGSGDLLEISVYGVPELSQVTRVSSTGDASLPLIGRVQLAGLTAEEAQALIESSLVDGGFLNHPHVSIFVKEYATQGITVLGEVARPGIYPLLGPRRLFDAISAAGGLTERAGRNVSITHRDPAEEPEQVILSRNLATDSDSNVQVLPGDTIAVSKAGVVYVVGEVNRPSGFVMDKNDDLTVLQVISLAGGHLGSASLGRTRLIRKTANGYQEIAVPLNKIMQAKAPDVPLQPDDIVFIPSSPGKKAAKRGIDAILQIATGVAIFGR